MCKKKINMPLYLLFVVNCIYAISEKTFNWLFYVSAGLTAIVLIFDIVGLVKNGREK